MTGLAATWARAQLEGLEAAGLLRRLEVRSGPQGARVAMGEERLVNFSANDYLGLAGDPRLASAAAEAIARHGIGAGASRLLVGDTEAHRSLERVLARMMGADAALVFGSGYAANVGVLSTLAGPGDVIFSDALNHASIIDGCRLSRAQVVVYPHADVGALARALERVRGERRIIVTESVFSMDGDRAPLSAIAHLAAEHRAALVVDEAHAIGVLGPRGSGLVGELAIEGRVDVRVGTLGKALGAYGAFVAASRPVIDLLVNRARSLVFSTALPAMVCAAAEQAALISITDPTLRARLFRHVDRLRTGLADLALPGLPGGASTLRGGLPGTADHAGSVRGNERTPIFSIVLGAPELAVEAAEMMRRRGLLVKPIRPPTVPEGTSRLRIVLSAAHADADVDALLAALEGFAATADLPVLSCPSDAIAEHRPEG